MRGLARNAVWNAAGFGAVGAINLFLIAFALRHVTPGEYGAYALASSATGLVTLLGFGLSMSVVRAVAMEAGSAELEARHLARANVAAAHAAYVALGAMVMVVALGLVMTLPHVIHVVDSGRSALSYSLVLIGAANAITVGASALTGVVRGRRNFRLLAVATTAGAVASAVVTVMAIQRLGIVALGVAALVASVVTPAVLGWWVSRELSWFRFLPIRPNWTEIRPVLGFAAPLVAVSVASRVVTATDALVLGVLATTAVVALYRVGAALPNGLISLLFTAYDVAFPTLAGSSRERTQEHVSAFLARVFGFLAGLVFGLVALFRNDIVQILLGRKSSLAAAVLIVFCAVWVVNTSTHGVSLLLIARARQVRLAGLVAAEAVANLVLTVVLVLVIGPVGAVIATLLTMAVSNWIVLPWLVQRELKGRAYALVFKHGLLSSVVGASLGGAIYLVTEQLAPQNLHMPVAAVLTAAVSIGVAAALLWSADGDLIRSAFARDLSSATVTEP